MQEYFKRPELKIGSSYDVELYPDKEISESSKYLGRSNGTHVFEGKIKIPIRPWKKSKVETANCFILLDDHWIMEVDKVVTYKPISSFGVEVHTKEDIEKAQPEVKSRLLKILAEVGVQL